VVTTTVSVVGWGVRRWSSPMLQDVAFRVVSEIDVLCHVSKGIQVWLHVSQSRTLTCCIRE
jgi:hypothetical protein